MSNLEVALKPMGSEIRHFFQGAGFLEQMGRPGNDLHFLLARESCERVAIEVGHDRIVAAHNKKGGGLNFRQRVAREVRSSAARDDRLDLPFKSGGGNQRRSRACTRAEKTKFEV